jgi:hypothetical protein
LFNVVDRCDAVSWPQAASIDVAASMARMR